MESRKNIIAVALVLAGIGGCLSDMAKQEVVASMLSGILYLCIQGKKDEFNAAVKFNNMFSLEEIDIKKKLCNKKGRAKQLQLYATIIATALPLIFNKFNIDMPPEVVGTIAGAIAAWLGFDRKCV